MNIHFIKPCIMAFSLFCLTNHFLMGQTQFPWPVTPFNQSQQITGNFSEYRSTSANGHFHNGTDIPKADGAPVYAVKTGVITSLSTVGSNAYVRVQDVAYVHIAPNPSLSVGDQVFASQTILGTILPGMGHVHFTNGYVGAEINSMLMNSGLTPYTDTWPPIIRFIQFYQNNTANEFSSNVVSGLVDIVVKVDEQNAPPGSPTSRLNNGTYKIGYKIFNADTSAIVFEPPNGGLRFRFNTKPDNSFVNIVYFRPLSSTTSHAYQVTNDVSQDNYWDTTLLPLGDYVVMAFTEDTRANTDTAYISVTVAETDLTPPEQPVFKEILETNIGMQLGWVANTEPDLAGYRLYFSFDNADWNLFRDESVLTPAITDTTINQILSQDVYFYLTAVDNAPLVNESIPSDVYGVSNGNIFSGKVLLVDGFDRTNGSWTQPGHSFVFTHGQAIISNQYSFDTISNEMVEDGLVNLNDYWAVIWLLGDESTADETFSPAEQALVKDYLENGGRLMVSGSQVAWDLDPDGYGNATVEDEAFLHEYLKVDYLSNSPSSMTAAGANNSIFSGLNFNFGQTPYSIDSADVISPFGGNAVAALKYDNTQIAGIQYQGTFGAGSLSGKLVYLGFPFETIDSAFRDEVMGRVLDFFFILAGVEPGGDDPGNLPMRYSLLQNYPNPFNPQTTIEYHLPTASKVTVEIYNLLGQKVITLVNGTKTAGKHQINWNARNDANQYIASGIYLIKFLAKSNNSSVIFQKTRKLMLIK